MSDSPEVPNEAPFESKPDMKERMQTFGEKAKAFGEKTGQRSKKIGKKVAEATKETTAKAAEATKKTTAKMAEAAKETTAKAAEVGKKAGSRLSESTAEVSEKISVAAEQAVESVGKSVKHTKEKIKQAKADRDERKAQAAQVPQTTQIIQVGPDLPDEPVVNKASEPVEASVDGLRNMVDAEKDAERASEGMEQKQFVILPPTTQSYAETQTNPAVRKNGMQTTFRTWSSSIMAYGPDLVFGWCLLFLALCTSANAITAFSNTSEQLQSIPFGIPHLDFAFESDEAWMNLLGLGLLFFLLLDGVVLSFTPATIGSFKRIALVIALIWTTPAIVTGLENLLIPFGPDDLDGFLWHILALPLILLTCSIRIGVLTVNRESELPENLELPGIEGTIGENRSTTGHGSPLISNMTVPLLSFEVEIMNAADEIMQKPRSRDKMEPYEFIFFMFMWVFLFGGIALLAYVGTRVNTSAEIPSDPFFFVAAACFGVCLILSYIVFKMDRSARSGIDMAKRRERYNAMQDEAWETKRVQYRLAREDMEQGMSTGKGSAAEA